MLNQIIEWSLEHRFLIILATIIFTGGSLYAVGAINIDAFPDTTPVQVQINAPAPGLAPEEVERQLTFPVEQSLGGLPRVQEVRSVTRFGLAQVVVSFDDGTDIYFARQQIGERLANLEIPEGRPRPKMGPIATGLGEVFHYMLRSPRRAASRRTPAVRSCSAWASC